MGLRQILCLFQRLESFALWIYMFLSTEFNGVEAEKCRKLYSEIPSSYQQNYGDDDYENDMVFTRCTWGCCYNRDTPCCTAPVSLIIGCAIGGILLICLATVAICCCWVCKRRRQVLRESAIRFGRAQPQPGDQQVVYHSETSGMVDLPPYAYDAPPSYDEVMRGETNSAFKPDNT